MSRLYLPPHSLLLIFLRIHSLVPLVKKNGKKSFRRGNNLTLYWIITASKGRITPVRAAHRKKKGFESIIKRELGCFCHNLIEGRRVVGLQAFQDFSHLKQILVFARFSDHCDKKSCVIISHNIPDIYTVSDKFVMIDRGEVVGEYRKSEISREELIENFLKFCK